MNNLIETKKVPFYGKSRMEKQILSLLFRKFNQLFSSGTRLLINESWKIWRFNFNFIWMFVCSREVQLRQCRRLSISLDFTRVDSTNYPVHFQHIEHLEIVSINFEPLYQDRQELELHFHNVQVCTKIPISDNTRNRNETSNVITDPQVRWPLYHEHDEVKSFKRERSKVSFCYF